MAQASLQQSYLDAHARGVGGLAGGSVGWLKRLRAEGLLGDDVAFAAWVAAQGDAPLAPWKYRPESPGTAARYGPRELTFWARWCADRRDDQPRRASRGDTG